MGRTTTNLKKHYFTDKLNQALEGVKGAPISLIEAPMGFGKTTAIKAYMAKEKFRNIWHYCYDNSTHALWDGICDLVGKVEKSIAFELGQLGLPIDEVLRREALKILGKVQLNEPIYVVFDDMHLVDSEMVNSLLDSIVRRSYKNLHIVVISRFTSLTSLEELKLKGILHHVTKEAFEFSAADILAYSKLSNLSIGRVEAEFLEVHTEGWVSSIYLFLLQYANNGDYGNPSSIYNLIENTIFNSFTTEAQSFLKCMCLSSAFTLKQAKFMWAGKNVSTMLEEIVTKNGFITYSHEEKTYHVHNLFTNYLKEIVEQENGMAAAYKHSADWAIVEKQYWDAMVLYTKANDYEGMLKALELDMGASVLSDRKNQLFEMIEQCPETIWMRHSKALLIYGINLISFNEIELFERNCQRIVHIIESGLIDNEVELNQLIGEFELLLSFTKFNNVLGMGEHLHKAAELVYRPIGFIDALEGGCSFGSPSILNLFYREGGSLSALMSEVKDTFPIYSSLAGGHGVGLSPIMDAEAALMQGALIKADILGHAAYRAALKGNQSDMIVNALFVQLKTELYKGEFLKATSYLDEMKAIVQHNHNYNLMHTIDLCEGYLYAILDQVEAVPSWLQLGESSIDILNFPVVSFANIITGRVLLTQKAYTKVIGLKNTYLEVASVFNNRLSQIYTHIYSSVAYYQLFMKNEALEALQTAILLSEEDAIIIPFAENYALLEPILEISNLSERNSGLIKSIHEMGKRIKANFNLIQEKNIQSKGNILMFREKEIAALAYKGLTNKEIAATLHISANTVKSTLKIVFEKQGIKSRALLRVEV